MSDQNSHDKVLSMSGAAAAGIPTAEQVAEKQAAADLQGPAALDPNILESATFTSRANPTAESIVQDMARMAKFLNKYAGRILTGELLSAANPAIQGLVGAAAGLEQGAVQLHMLIQQHKQQQMAGMAQPGAPQAVRMPGGPGSGFPN